MSFIWNARQITTPSSLEVHHAIANSCIISEYFATNIWHENWRKNLIYVRRNTQSAFVSVLLVFLLFDLSMPSGIRMHLCVRTSWIPGLASRSKLSTEVAEVVVTRLSLGLPRSSLSHFQLLSKWKIDASNWQLTDLEAFGRWGGAKFMVEPI